MKFLKKKTVFNFLQACFILSLVLIFLFKDLLLPQNTLFSNDGTLGLLKSQEKISPSNLLNVWIPNGWIGSTQPAATFNLTTLLFLIFDAVVYSKLNVPLSLLFLGLSIWYFCRAARFKPIVGLLAGISATLNSNPFSYACWGLAPKSIALSFALLSIASLSDTNWKGW